MLVFEEEMHELCLCADLAKALRVSACLHQCRESTHTMASTQTSLVRLSASVLLPLSSAQLFRARFDSMARSLCRHPGSLLPLPPPPLLPPLALN